MLGRDRSVAASFPSSPCAKECDKLIAPNDKKKDGLGVWAKEGGPLFFQK